jgi:uncharacterized protein YbbK (DUF523 family)
VQETGADKLRVGVSACLLGHEVRYDGQHKRDAFLIQQLEPYVQWVAVCPELEVGMGVPREPVQLVRDRAGGTRLAMVGNRSAADWTARMTSYAASKVKALEGLAGYVLKSRSPSCGMEGVKVHDRQHPDVVLGSDGVGLFAAALRARFPNLPMEEDGRLSDPRRCESFIERLFAYHRTYLSQRGR